MDTRDTHLVGLRPEVQADLTADPEGSPGHFQHAVLRPILKLQNPLLLHVFRQYIRKTKGTFFQLPLAKRPEFIAHGIRTDQRFRHLLLGLVMGHFTEAEWQFFQSHEQEVTRRIMALLIQRLTDQVEALAD